MALIDDLKAYVTKNAQKRTDITEKHDTVVVGEWHAFLNSEEPNLRTTAVVRLLLELFENTRYRYFANESYLNSGPVRAALRAYLRDQSLPPAFDSSQKDPDILETARRVLPRRYKQVLDFLIAHPRYVLPIGSSIDGPARDARLAQHLFEEAADRKMLTPGTPGIVLLGAFHATAVGDADWPSTRMLMDKRGYSCVSVRVLTDFVPPKDKTDNKVVPDDRVVPVGTDLNNIQPSDEIRLTSLVDNTPVTIPTVVNGQDNPFQKVTFGTSDHSVAEQFQYIVLQKA
jgi:hypothetical protein